MRKILISPSYGAGWSTWHGNREVAKFALTYQPIIDFIEGGGKFSRDVGRFGGDEADNHPLLVQLTDDIKAKFGEDETFYVGGACDLEVVTVEAGQAFRINEYDGYETLVRHDSESYWCLEDES